MRFTEQTQQNVTNLQKQRVSHTTEKAGIEEQILEIYVIFYILYKKQLFVYEVC